MWRASKGEGEFDKVSFSIAFVVECHIYAPSGIRRIYYGHFNALNPISNLLQLLMT